MLCLAQTHGSGETPFNAQFACTGAAVHWSPECKIPVWQAAEPACPPAAWPNVQSAPSDQERAPAAATSGSQLWSHHVPARHRQVMLGSQTCNRTPAELCACMTWREHEATYRSTRRLWETLGYGTFSQCTRGKKCSGLVLASLWWHRLMAQLTCTLAWRS